MHDAWKKSRFLLIGVAVVLLFAAGCQGERMETPTKGRTTVVVSESVAPVIQQEKEKFEELYQQAHVELITATAREAIARFFNDTIKVIVSSRELNTEERNVAKQANFQIGEYKIAIDGIAIIVNEDNPVTQLRTTELDSIYRGIVTNWKSIDGKSGSIKVCLPDRNSGIYEIVMNKILNGQNFAPPAHVANSSPEMVDYVANEANAIGMVGINHLRDKTDTVKVVALADPNAPDSLGIRGEYFEPHQAHLYWRYYPLTHTVYLYSRADQYGVAAGFITFITNAAGQKIVLNSGLVPATMPVRLVELTKKEPTP